MLGSVKVHARGVSVQVCDSRRLSDGGDVEPTVGSPGK